MRPGKRGYSNTWEVACYYWARISLGACGSICGSGGWQALIDPRSSRCFLAAGFSARKGALCQFLLQKGRRQSWRRIRVILISDAWPHHPCSALPGSSLAVRHNLKLADVDRREQNGRPQARYCTAPTSGSLHQSQWQERYLLNWMIFEFKFGK